MILARRGELDEAAGCLHEARKALSRFPADRHVSIFADLAEAVLAVEQGRFDVARSTAIGMDAGNWDSLRPLGLAMLAEAHIRVGKPEEACRIARTIAVHGTSEHPYPAALADQIEGLAFAQRVPAPGETERALVCLRRAAEAFKALEIPFEFARCQLAWARLAAGTDPTSVEVARESAEIFERLGARSYMDQARALLRALGIRPVANRRSRAGPAELSARELAVVRLAVAGLTTADIAERLVVSPHTVTTHLKRVYERFGIHSRASLVRYAEQAGWLEAGDKNS